MKIFDPLRSDTSQHLYWSMSCAASVLVQSIRPSLPNTHLQPPSRSVSFCLLSLVSFSDSLSTHLCPPLSPFISSTCTAALAPAFLAEEQKKKKGKTEWIASGGERGETTQRPGGKNWSGRIAKKQNDCSWSEKRSKIQQAKKDRGWMREAGCITAPIRYERETERQRQREERETERRGLMGLGGGKP